MHCVSFVIIVFKQRIFFRYIDYTCASFAIIFGTFIFFVVFIYFVICEQTIKFSTNWKR